MFSVKNKPQEINNIFPNMSEVLINIVIHLEFAIGSDIIHVKA